MRFILGAMAAVTMLVGMAVAQPAEARCFWNGFAMECFHRHHDWGWDRPYRYGGYGGYRGYDRPAYWGGY